MALCLNAGRLCLRISKTALQPSSQLHTLHCIVPQQPLVLRKKDAIGVICIRNMSAKRQFVIFPTRFVWRRFKRDFHFFVMLGIIPLTLITIYANVFVGPAELAEIPEGYVPEEYEYYKSPVTRWLQKHILQPPQQGYEMMLHRLDVETEKMRLRRLHKRIRALQAERMDYMGYMANRGPTTKFIERLGEDYDTLNEERRDPVGVEQ